MVGRLLNNLGNCAFPPKTDIYIVENGSQAGTEVVCSQNTVGNRVRYLYSPSAGRSLAMNLAIRHSDADFFLFLDDDVTVRTDFVKNYVDAAQRYGPGYFFGGPLIADAEVPCPAHLLPYLPPSARGRSLADQEFQIEPSHFDYFFGANWAVFRIDLMKSGLFAEHLGVSDRTGSPMGEESDLQRRLIDASAKPIFLPNAVIHHFVPKECYTSEWVCQRHFRLGLTHILEKQGTNDSHIYSWYQILQTCGKVLEMKCKVLLSLLLLFPIERRTRIKVREAYLRGRFYGALKQWRANLGLSNKS